MHAAEELIEFLGLSPLEMEGGWYRQTYISEGKIPARVLPKRYTTEKPLSTSIYYLLSSAPGSFSVLHRLPTDEIYHFYLGDPVEMLLLEPGGRSELIILGGDLFNGQHVQYPIPAGVWQGSRLLEGGDWALMGTTMAPGFTPGDFELGLRKELIAAYPDRKEWIVQLTRGE